MNILDYTHKLKQNLYEGGVSYRYDCPVCGGHNLTVNEATGYWNCWSHDNEEHRKEIVKHLVGNNPVSTSQKKPVKKAVVTHQSSEPKKVSLEELEQRAKKAQEQRKKAIEERKQQHREFIDAKFYDHRCKLTDEELRALPYYNEWCGSADVGGSAVKENYFRMLVESGYLYQIVEAQEMLDTIYGLGAAPGHIKKSKALNHKGGWFTRSFNPQTLCDGFSKFGNYKFPKNAQEWDVKRGKYKKYSVPHGRDQEPQFYPLTELSWLEVLKDTDIPIIIVEGSKKACTMICRAYVVICLQGVWVANKRVKKDYKELHPYLKPFAQPGRQFYVCFDNDPVTRKNTRTNVGQALDELAINLRKATKVEPKVMVWSEFEEKGIDDLVAARGEQALNNAYENAVPLGKWQATHYLNLYGECSVRCNQRYLPNLEVPQNSRIIGIKSPKGTGKTEFLKNLVDGWYSQTEKRIQEFKQLNFLGEDEELTEEEIKLVRDDTLTIVLTHRVSLGEALAKRLNLPFINNGKGSSSLYSGAVACVDSIRKVKKILDESGIDNYRIIFDEFTQVLWHLCSAKTEIDKFRPQAWSILREMLNGAMQVLVADADLNTMALDWLQDFMVVHNDDVFTVINDFKFRNRPITKLSNDVAVWHRCLAAVGDGKRIAISTQSSGKTNKSAKFSSKNIEKMLGEKFPNLKILRIDGESISDPDHPAFDCTPHINKLVKDYDVVIFTPVLETGVSIDEGHGFSAVFGFMQGVGSPMTAVQQLSRVRGEVAKYYHCSKVGLTWNTNITSAKKIEKHLLTQKHKSIQTLTGYGIAIDDVEEDKKFLKYFSRWAAMLNSANYAYDQWVDSILENEGYEITEVKVATNKELKNECKDSGEELADKYYQEVSAAPEMSNEEFEHFSKNDKQLTAPQRKQVKKKSFEKLTHGVMGCSPENLKKFDDGWVRKMKQHWMLMNLDAAADSDVWELEIKKHQKTVTAVGFRADKLLRSQLLKKVGVLEFIETFLTAPLENSNNSDCTPSQNPNILTAPQPKTDNSALHPSNPSISINTQTEARNNDYSVAEATFNENLYQKGCSQRNSNINILTAPQNISTQQPKEIKIIDTNNPILLRFVGALERGQWELKDIFGLKLKKNQHGIAPIQCANQILGLLGLRLAKAKTIKGKRFYKLTGLDDGRLELFKKWDEENTPQKREDRLINHAIKLGFDKTVSEAITSVFKDPAGIMTMSREFEKRKQQILWLLDADAQDEYSNWHPSIAKVSTEISDDDADEITRKLPPTQRKVFEFIYDFKDEILAAAS